MPCAQQTERPHAYAAIQPCSASGSLPAHCQQRAGPCCCVCGPVFILHVAHMHMDVIERMRDGIRVLRERRRTLLTSHLHRRSAHHRPVSYWMSPLCGNTYITCGSSAVVHRSASRPCSAARSDSVVAVVCRGAWMHHKKQIRCGRTLSGDVIGVQRQFRHMLFNHSIRLYFLFYTQRRTSVTRANCSNPCC